MIPMKRLKQAASWILQIAIVLLFAFVFVWYFGQRVSTVGDSMSPILSNGDVVLVNRFVYNASAPKRGDIIVFKPKGNENSHYYIKRIIGLPGETVEILEGTIYIDGEKLTEDYETAEISDVGIVTGKISLGGDEYFVLGDDRGKSEDSRMADVGNVKRSYIYGKAWLIVSPLDHFGFL
ncbi:MAG: signal peptidase I [Eubacteriales bacterium]|nr:signal peptidase I [Eubacteriales bacterium]